MYIAIFHSQPQREGHGLQSNRFVKLLSSPLTDKNVLETMLSLEHRFSSPTRFLRGGPC